MGASGRDNTKFDVELPPEWADGFKEGTVRLSEMQWYRMGDLNWPILVFKASTQANPAVPVEFHVVQTGCPSVTQERLVMSHLDPATTPHVFMSGDRASFTDQSFLAYPAPESTLQDLLVEPRAARGLPQSRSLPILVDILRGLQSLEKVGVVHCDLVPENVVFSGDRAFVGGLGRAHMEDGDFPVQAVGSPFRKAPEVSPVVPVENRGRFCSTNHVWSAGVLFAEMLFGAEPTERYLMKGPNSKWDPEGLVAMGKSYIMRRRDLPGGKGDHPGAEGLNRLRRIDMVAGWEQAPAGVQALLRGLLSEDYSARWNTTYALERAEAVAAELGIAVPAAAPPLLLPPGWLGRAVAP